MDRLTRPDSISDLEILKWGQGLHPFLAWFARKTALSAESIYQLCVVARMHVDLEDGQGAPPFEYWLDLYTKPERVFKTLRKAVVSEENGDNTGQFFMSVLDGVNAYQQLSKEEKEREVREALSGVKTWEEYAVMAREFEKELTAIYEDDIRDMLKTCSNDPCEDEASRKLLFSPDGQFYLQVWLPCWFQYGVSVTSLFHRAANGERKELHKLLQLDPYVIQRREILRHYAGERDRDAARQLDYNLRGGEGKIGRTRVKETLAGFIDKVFREVDEGLRQLDREFPVVGGRRCRVTLKEPEIRALFDAVAKDLNGPDAIDTDIPDSPEAFQKAIYRARRHFWPAVEKIGLFL